MLDQISPEGTALAIPSTFLYNQVFEKELEDFTSAIADDFVSNGSTVKNVSVAFALDGGTFNNLAQAVRGFRISFFDSESAFFNSGLDFADHAVATVLATQEIRYRQLEGTSVTEFPVVVRADISGLTMNIGAGHRWMVVTPYMDFGMNGLAFMLRNRSPLFRGGGGVADSIASNPKNGFGYGVSILANYDAAYAINAVPEPGLLCLFGSSVMLFVKRRRRDA